MPIYAPDRRINPTLKRRSHSGRKSVMAGLYLTSMVDMFAIMVIFLLQSFSAEGELIILPKGLELPEAQNTGILEKAPVLTISREKVEFEGVTVAATPDVSTQEGWVIPALQDALKNYRKTLESKSPDQAPQKINISADRRLQFQVVKKVIYNASYAGFPDFRFAVFGKKNSAPEN